MKQQMNKSGEEFDAIVDWLNEEYDLDKIKDMLFEAKMYKDNDIITIQYSNGVIDTVRYNKGNITQIN